MLNSVIYKKNIKWEYPVSATLGAARTLLLPALKAAVNPLPFKMCAFLYLADYFLSQMH